MTTLIKGGMVYDGTGGVPREADVLLEGKTIVRIGPRLSASAKEVIAARGALVCPGFVDIANYADHYGALFSDPAGTEPLIRGITSIVVGQGGASLSPLLAHGAIPESWWGNAASTAAHTTTMEEFFSLLKGRMGVNTGTLVGYATVRESVAQGVPRDLTDREFELLERLLRRALKEGALGVSVNLEYVRTARAPRREFLAAARAAEEADALFALRLRTREAGLKESLTEALSIAEATDANLLITDLEPYARDEAAYHALATQLTRASAEHHVHFTTSGTGVAGLPLPLLLPPHLREEEQFTMSERLTDPAVREELRAHLARYRDLPLYVASVADSSLKLFEGTQFAKWSLHEHLPFEDALMRLMAVTHFRAVLVAKVGERELVSTFASHDRALLASGEAAAPSLETSAQLSFLAEKERPPRLARSSGEAGGALPVEQRIARMTGAPAKKLGLSRRGTLKEGHYADLLVIEKGVVREAFVNGIRAVREGAPTGERGGTILART